MEKEEKVKKKKHNKKKKGKKSRSLSPGSRERLDESCRVYRGDGTPPRHSPRASRRKSDDSSLQNKDYTDEVVTLVSEAGTSPDATDVDQPARALNDTSREQTTDDVTTGKGQTDDSPSKVSKNKRNAKKNKKIQEASEAGSPAGSKDGSSSAVSSYQQDIDKRIDDLVNVMMALNKTLEDQAKEIDASEQALDQIENSAALLQKMHGKSRMIWRITEFSSHLARAVKGTHKVLHSPTFSSHLYGYTMMMCACPNGDDADVHGKFMSVFFCLVQGKWDSLLEWPFRHPVTFTLLDQSDDIEKRQHVSKTFYPYAIELNLPFLGRPTTARNASVGFKKFIALEELTENNFVKNDVMYIEVFVDNDTEC